MIKMERNNHTVITAGERSKTILKEHFRRLILIEVRPVTPQEARFNLIVKRYRFHIFISFNQAQQRPFQTGNISNMSTVHPTISNIQPNSEEFKMLTLPEIRPVTLQGEASFNIIVRRQRFHIFISFNQAQQRPFQTGNISNMSTVHPTISNIQPNSEEFKMLTLPEIRPVTLQGEASFNIIVRRQRFHIFISFNQAQQRPFQTGNISNMSTVHPTISNIQPNSEEFKMLTLPEIRPVTLQGEASFNIIVRRQRFNIFISFNQAQQRPFRTGNISNMSTVHPTISNIQPNSEEFKMLTLPEIRPVTLQGEASFNIIVRRQRFNIFISFNQAQQRPFRTGNISNMSTVHPTISNIQPNSEEFKMLTLPEIRPVTLQGEASFNIIVRRQRFHIFISFNQALQRPFQTGKI
ncbi:hypothetical protein GE061_011905 [Apolygus lucorum]|uniref:Uncharacterized protein n=1 Tax=Apolygus lucorum TaxID=248454 RepID=A0A8S9XR27_APOLU|nr:hypothetical protein GE061_011905 [Apolygus lucorum]